MPEPTTIVVAAAVCERDGRYLLARRLRGTHLEGLWEFPGGKCEPGETLAACLAREIREELGCGVAVGDEMLAASHAYGDRTVELHFFSCSLQGTPQPLLGQELRWAPVHALRTLELPPADEGLIRLLEARTAASPRSG